MPEGNKNSCLEVYTELANYFEDAELGWVVRHISRNSEDSRRTTRFYFGLSDQNARVLATALNGSEAACKKSPLNSEP